MNLKTIKYLDVQWGSPKMPDDIKQLFFNEFDGTSNDVWVEYEVGESHSMLDTWLVENTDLESGENVMLKHWW